jgi:hypothetical protein
LKSQLNVVPSTRTQETDVNRSPVSGMKSKSIASLTRNQFHTHSKMTMEVGAEKLMLTF